MITEIILDAGIELLVCFGGGEELSSSVSCSFFCGGGGCKEGCFMLYTVILISE